MSNKRIAIENDGFWLDRLAVVADVAKHLIGGDWSDSEGGFAPMSSVFDTAEEFWDELCKRFPEKEESPDDMDRADGDIEIFVNQHRVVAQEGEMLSYEDIVGFACLNTDTLWTVTYKINHKAGTLTPGVSCYVFDGAKFTVVDTSNA